MLFLATEPLRDAGVANTSSTHPSGGAEGRGGPTLSWLGPEACVVPGSPTVAVVPQLGRWDLGGDPALWATWWPLQRVRGL